MSYNIRNIEGGDSFLSDPLTFEYTNRNTYVLNAIKEENPDVLGLQEACTKEHTNPFASPNNLSWFSTLEGSNGLTNNGYTAYRGLSILTSTATNKQMYNPIYYKTDKFNFIAGGTEIITASASGSDKKSATWVILETKEGGQRFIFISVHFQAHSEDADKAARIENAEKSLALINRLKTNYDYPVILLGDFNESNGGGGCKLILQSGFADALAAAKTKVNDSQGTFVKDFVTILNNTKLDHIFTKDLPQYAYISYYETVDNKHITGSVGKYPSDHLPVIVYIEFPIIH